MEEGDGRSRASPSSSSLASSGSTSSSWSASAVGSRGPAGPVAKLGKDSNRLVGVENQINSGPFLRLACSPKTMESNMNGKLKNERYW